MDQEIGMFLRSRRAKLTPEDVGLPNFGNRRVPGLRREELAQLAGVSVDYYVRLEQGRCPHVSDNILDAIGRALELSTLERQHLSDLARPRDVNPGPKPADQSVSSTLQRLLVAMGDVPAFILGRRTDILASNPLAATLMGLDTTDPRRRNTARFVFSHPDAPTVYPDWREVATQTVAWLVLDAGRHPGDPELARLVGELSIASDTFRELWARHDIHEQPQGVKRVAHPLTGPLDLEYQALTIPDSPDQLLCCLVPAANSATAEKLMLLASWTHSRPDHVSPAASPGPVNPDVSSVRKSSD